MAPTHHPRGAHRYAFPPAGLSIANLYFFVDISRYSEVIKRLYSSSPLPRGRLSVALCAGEHDPLRVPAAPLRPQRWQPAHGRRLHQQPTRQVEPCAGMTSISWASGKTWGGLLFQ